MFDFQWPWMAVLLLVPVVIWLRRVNRAIHSMDRQERQVTLLHPHLHNLQSAFQTRRPDMTFGSRIYYTLLALSDIDLPAARKERQYAAPLCESLLKRKPKDDRVDVRRRHLAERVLVMC